MIPWTWRGAQSPQRQATAELELSAVQGVRRADLQMGGEAPPADP